MFGRQVRMPIDIMYGNPIPQPTTIPQYCHRSAYASGGRVSAGARADGASTQATKRYLRQESSWRSVRTGRPGMAAQACSATGPVQEATSP